MEHKSKTTSMAIESSSFFGDFPRLKSSYKCVYGWIEGGTGVNQFRSISSHGTRGKALDDMLRHF